MLIKFLRHGTGSAAEAAEYLLGELDYLGTEREEVEVLRGDPHEVAAVADSLEFEHTHKSGVIAWAPEDSPTREQIERTLEEFEKIAWAGMEADQYAWSAVLHREKEGGAHVHVLAANCELEHGRSHNIAAPGWQRIYDPLRDALNHEHGWARPDDPERIRLVRPQGHEALREAAERRAGKEPEKTDRRELGEYLIERAAAGEVGNRKDVVEALEELGLEVKRQGEHYVTVEDGTSGKRMRLKGGIYERGFDAEKIGRADRGEEGGGGGDSDEPPGGGAADSEERKREREERVEELWEQVASIREGRGRAHQERYRRKPKRAAIADREETVVEPGERVSVRDRGGAGIVGADQLPELGHPAEDRDAAGTGGGDRGTAGDRRAARRDDVGGGAGRGRRRTEVRGAAGGDVSPGSALDRGRAALGGAIERVKQITK
ncbi:MAG: relaxase/mobilization nuclease domain-containing protein, partial [Gemmatimonadetes bacterium]|nr:relaxase/mobilization nuclease domain-containing protein [Gemmatimonadota bacterium]